MLGCCGVEWVRVRVRVPIELQCIIKLNAAGC